MSSRNCSELGVRVGDVALHELLVGQQRALGLPAERPLAQHVERLLGEADGAHGVVDAPAAEAGLGDGEGLALAAEQGVLGHPHVLVVDEGVGAVAQRLAAEADVADDVDARACRSGPGTSTCPCTALTSGLVTTMTMRNEAVLAFDEKNFQPLMTHSSPSFSARVVNMRGVGAGVGLGHRVAGEDLAVEQRVEVLLLLLVGAVVGDDLGVAGVGGLAAEDDRGPLRAAQDLVQQRQLELAVARRRPARGRGGSPTGPGAGPPP